MIPWKVLVKINKTSPVPVYLQAANAIIREIKNGLLKPGSKLPGSRELSTLLDVHRQTVVNAYAELEAQGWIITRSSKGSFINEELPEKDPEDNALLEKQVGFLQTRYPVKLNALKDIPPPHDRTLLGFYDGPDVRLVPVKEIARTYRTVLTRKSYVYNLSYVDMQGRELLRRSLSEDMNLNKGMNTSPDNVIITRGSQMSIFLVASVLLSKNDKVVVCELDYYNACQAFANAGASLLKVPVDNQGMNIEDLAKICKRTKIRAVYVTAHHHYPTTVTLSVDRRMKLLALAEQYGFVIIEDDYDYNFHYHSNPILPIASADKNGMVIYIGSMSTIIAPFVRIGYIAAPKNLIDEVIKYRRMVDLQGDPVFEQVMGELMQEGEIKRFMKKALREYRARRDFMCSTLQEKLSDAITFKVPDGGLAIWANFHKKISIPKLAQQLRDKKVMLRDGQNFNQGSLRLNATRMGFGWMNLQEADKALKVLHDTIRKEF